MISRFVVIFFAISFFSCSPTTNKYSVQNFGNDFSKESIQSFSQIMQTPSEFLGKSITIEGEIIDVCPMKGCWIEVKDYKSNKTLRVKVKDDVIIFPQDSRTKKTIVNGIFTKLEFTEEQAVNWKIHLAKEKGLNISEDEVELTPSDLVEYRIKGIGAQIFTELN